jgi:hypothetical protein
MPLQRPPHFVRVGVTGATVQAAAPRAAGALIAAAPPSPPSLTAAPAASAWAVR